MLTAASGRDLSTAGDMAAVIYWRLTALAPTNPGPLPWLPGIPETLHDHPIWGDYLAKRSQLVADLANQVQDHACQGDAKPIWTPPESHPSPALIGEIAVWRAANGINRRNPTRNAPGSLETTPGPEHRSCHLPARRCEDQRAEGTTLRAQSKPRQATLIPNTRSTPERATCAQPIAHLSRRIAAL